MDDFKEYNDVRAESIDMNDITRSLYEAEKIDPDFTDMDISNESCDLKSICCPDGAHDLGWMGYFIGIRNHN